jgi:hypothetical protein
MSVFDSLENMVANTPSLEASLALLQPILVERAGISSYELLASFSSPLPDGSASD